MANWASTADVAARLSYRTISASSEPSLSDVSGWLDEGEAYLRAALRVMGLDPNSVTAIPDAVFILGRMACDYAEGRVRQVWATAEIGDGADDGVKLLDDFNEKIEDMMDRPDRWAQLLNLASAPSKSVFMRGPVPADLEDDNDPVFTRDMEV